MILRNKALKSSTEAALGLPGAQASAAADRASVLEAVAQGTSLEEAAAPYVGTESFEAWYTSFCDALEGAAGKQAVR